MPTHVALLRGINVGGHNRVAMAELRALVASLGHEDVATYIQSGNVLFTTGRSDARDLAAELEAAMAERLDVRCASVVLPCSELARIAEANPFAGEPDPKAVHVVFLGEAASDAVARTIADAARIAREAGSPDAAAVRGAAVYLHTPGGLGRSRLAAELNRGPRGSPGTARNWSTVTKLLAMCRSSLPA
jgi:uncharacterized protein (DUF1697 family)